MPAGTVAHCVRRATWVSAKESLEVSADQPRVAQPAAQYGLKRAHRIDVLWRSGVMPRLAGKAREDRAGDVSEFLGLIQASACRNFQADHAGHLPINRPRLGETQVPTVAFKALLPELEDRSPFSRLHLRQDRGAGDIQI